MFITCNFNNKLLQLFHNKNNCKFSNISHKFWLRYHTKKKITCFLLFPKNFVFYFNACTLVHIDFWTSHVNEDDNYKTKKNKTCLKFVVICYWLQIILKVHCIKQKMQYKKLLGWTLKRSIFFFFVVEHIHKIRCSRPSFALFCLNFAQYW